MATIWDWLTPWDTEEEKKAKAAEAAASFDRALTQRAPAAPVQGPAPRPAVDPLDGWAAAVAGITPAQGPAPRPDPWADALAKFQPPEPKKLDPVQEWRAAQAVELPDPGVSVGLGFDRPDTGPSPLGATQTTGRTVSLPDLAQGPQREPAAAWNAFANTFDRWVAQPAAAAAQANLNPLARLDSGSGSGIYPAATGVLSLDRGLNALGQFVGEDLPDWYTSQPGYLKAQADYEKAQARGVGDQRNNAQMFLNQILGVPGKVLENTPIPGTGALLGLEGPVSAGDFLSAFGTVVNQAINPLNPNAMTDAAREAVQQQMAEGASFTEVTGIQAQLEKAVANRALLDALPEQLRSSAVLALNTTISGADNVRQAISDILGQPEQVQVLYQYAEEARNKGDALGAAEYARQAEELRNKTAAELVDDNTNIWAEIIGGIVLDPTNLVGPAAEAAGITTEATAAAKNLKLFNMTPEAAQRAIDSAMPTVRQIADQIGMGDVTNFWARVNPFARTGDTLAHASSNNLFRTAATVFNGVATKDEAAAIMQNLVTNPANLIQESVTGPGTVGNAEFLKDLPILLYAQEQLQTMRSLAGGGSFNPVEFLSEFDNIVYQTARRQQGLNALDELPQGAVKFKLTRTEGGTGVIEYLDKSGKVVGQSAEMVYYNAQQELKTLTKAIQGGGGQASSLLRAHDQVQRAIMSDLWLNLRPAHWIRNALSAATTLFADDLMTLRPTASITAGLERRFGGAVPTQRLFEASGGVREMTGGQSIFRKLGPIGAPIAALAEAGGRVWSGTTDIAGRIPFGEQNFYLRAFNQPFERFLNSHWRDVVDSDFGRALTALGVDETLIKRLSAIATDAGATGSKADVARAVREAVNLPTISPNLRELGIAPDALSPQGWQEVNTLLKDGLPAQVEQVAQELRQIVGRETERWLKIVSSSPAQPGRYDWTELYQAADGADIIDNLTQAAKRAGIDVDTAKKQATEFAQSVLQREQQALEALRGEVAAAETPAALTIAIDLWGRIDELKRVARGQVDELGQQAVTANTAEAWGRKWEATRQLYDDLSNGIQGAVDEARTDLLALGRGETPARRFDFWTIVQRYANYDEEATRAARQAGYDLGAPTADGGFREVVEANRDFIDMSFAEVMAAFRRFSSTDALDVVASTQRNIDRLGAQAAGYLADAREQLVMGMMSKERYYGLRNRVWSQFFDNAAMMNKVATWEIVQDGLARQTETMLRWVDEFAGGEFKLIAPGKDGIWTAKNLADGTVHRFADPTRGGPGDVSSMPRVPQEVVADFYRITGQAEKLLQDTVQEIVDEVAPRFQIPKSADEFMQMLQRGTAPPDEVIPQSVAQQSTDLTQLSNADARQALAELTSRIRSAEDVGDETLGDALRAERNQYINELQRRKGAVQPVAQATTQAIPFDQQVQQAANATTKNVLGEKVFISQVYETVKRDNPNFALTLDEFKQQLAEAARRGEIQLARADMAYALDQNDVTASLLRLSSGSTGEVHFIRQKPETRTYELTVPSIDFEALAKRIQARIAKPYTLAPLEEGAFNPWGLLADVPQDARNVLKSINDGIRNTGQTTPEVGDAAHYMVSNTQQAVERIIQQLPDLLAGTPNALTPAQRLRAIDAVNALAAKHDDILAAAVKTGQDVANFAMLNYNDRRNFDTLLQLAIPYHYFWSRSAANWARRVAQKPAIANAYYEAQRGIDAQNERDQIPVHLRSTIGIPGTQYRVTNPLPYMLPFMMYGPSAFVDPNEAQTEAGRWINTVVQWSPGLLPTIDLARKYLVEGDLSDVSIGDYVPQYKIGGYAQQALTGQTMSGPLSYADEFEQGRIGKQVSLANVRGDIDKQQALWGMDIGVQQQTGQGPLPEQPAGTGDIWTQGAKDSGLNRLITTAGGYLTGLGIYPYSPEEQQIRAISDTRRNLGYDEARNLYGSQGAVNAFDEQTGDVTDPYYAYRQLYPQDGSGYGEPTRPGVMAVDAEKKAAKDAINAQMATDLDAYLAANPGATNDDIYDFKAPYYDQIDALDLQFPSASVYPQLPPVTTDPTGYMDYAPTDFYNNYSPEELQARAQESAVFQARDELAGQKPVYPEGGSKEQINQYYRDKEAYDKAVETRVQEFLDDPTLLSSLVNARDASGTGPQRPGEAVGPLPPGQPAPEQFPEIAATGFQPASVGLTGEQRPGTTDAATLITQVDQRNMTDAEIAQREKNAEIAEAKRAKYLQGQADWAAKRAGIVSEFGDDAGGIWDAYYDLPKGDARKQYAAEHPEIKVYNLAAYNPTEYAQAKELFGSDNLMAWAATPAYADTPEAKVVRNAYYDANPKAWSVNAWMWGRSVEGGETTYDFGQDYNQAMELFGDDIWSIVEGYKRGWGKDIKRWYYDKHPQLSEFFDWWYGNDGAAKAAGSGARSSGGGGGGSYYGGGGGAEQYRVPAANIQMPYSQGLNSELARVSPAAGGWQPSQVDLRWLEAGRNLSRGMPRESKPTWIRKTGGTF